MKRVKSSTRRSLRRGGLAAGAVLALIADFLIGTPAPAAPTAVPCASAGADEATAMAAARSCGGQVKVTDLTSETTEVFAQANGTFRSVISAGPVRVARPDGSWADVDYGLQRVDGGWAPKVSPARVVFSAGGNSSAVSLDSGSRGLDMSWPTSLPPPTIAGNSAFYRLTDTETLVLSATADGFEQSLQLSAPPTTAPKVRLGFATTGMDMVANSTGGYDFVNPGDKSAVFTMPKPTMYSSQVVDEEHTQVRSVPVTLSSDHDGTRYLELTGDMAFLSDPATVYPVWIDPTVSSVSRYGDTYVTQADALSHVSDPDLRIGLSSNGNIRRSLIRFNTAGSIPAGTVATSATLALYNNTSSTCSARSMYAYPITETYTMTNATWANQPTYTTSSSYSASASFSYGNETLGCANNTGYITVTNMVKAWLAGTLTDYGLILKAGSETDTTYAKYFCSMNVDTTGATACTTSTRYPTLSIVYNTYPDPLNGVTLQPGDGVELGTTTPRMRGVFSDDDGGTGRLDFEIYNRAGTTLVTSGAGTTVASGSESSWTVPSAKLAANTTYKWRSRGYDGGLYSGWSAWRYLSTADSSRVGEQRRFSFEEQKLTDRLELKANVANGNLLLKHTDFKIRGTGIDLELGRYYNSRSGIVSTLGKGWTLGVGHDVKLSFSGTDHTTADVTYQAPTGFTATFRNDGANAWRTPPGIDAKLTRDITLSPVQFRLKFNRSEASFYFADSTGLLLREVDRNNRTISFGYNTAGQVSTVTDTQGRVVTFAYTAGRLESITDWTGRQVSYTYYTSGDLQTVTDPAGGVTRFDYTGGLITRITTAESGITNLTYTSDGTGRVNFFQRYDPGNGNPTEATTSFEYLSGQTKVTDPNGNQTSDTTDGITTYKYEERDRVTDVTDALGHNRSRKYTSDDNVQTMTDGLLNTTTFGWDPNTNNLTSATLPTGAKSQLTYGDTTHPYSVTQSKDPQGNTLTYSYDGPGNKRTTSSAAYPAAPLETLEHNADGTVNYRLDGKGVKTAFSYDTKGNLIKVDNPAPLGDIMISPDALSRMGSQTDGKGQTTTYTYDDIDRIDVVTYADRTTVDYDYDQDGNLTKVTDPTGITGFDYDKLNRNWRKTLPSNEQLRYDYDHNGNLTSYSDSGGTVTYTYDQVNLLKTLLEPGASTPVAFDYDNNNRRRHMYLPTSPRVTVDMQYDKSGRQTSIIATNDSTAAQLSKNTYSYTKNGADTALRQTMTDLSGTTTYGYDTLNRLTSATGAVSRSYGYDANSNRTSKTESGTSTTYTYNDPQELTAAGSTTYSYDGNGNKTSSTSGWALAYNAANQTTSIQKPSGTNTLTPIVYSGQGQNELVQAGNDTFVNSALGISSATASSNGGSDVVNDDSSSPKKGTRDYYTRDNEGNLVSLRTGGTSYYYLLDGISSVVGLVNTAAVKVNSYGYDPYGKQQDVSQTVSNPWRYASGFYHTLTGMTKFGARYYNPELGRFTQRDPSGKDLPYSYAGCDPINNADPTGLQLECLEATFLMVGALFAFGAAVLAAPPTGGASVAAVVSAIIGTGLLSLAADINFWRNCVRPEWTT